MFASALLLGGFLLLSGRQAASQNIISLVGENWELTNPELNISVPAQWPSYAHLDLYNNQVIGDPLFGTNNYNLRFVARANWTYTTSKPIAGLSSNASTTTWLLFNGLDTFTDIQFCGQHVASTHNQFRQYWFDVSSILASCSEANRTLSINFGSAPKIADEIASQPGQETWPDGVMQLYQFPNRWFIRKEQSDFGWDWGPAFSPTGPWQPAFVIQLQENQVQVRNSLVDIYRQGQLNNLPPDQNQPWILNASLDYFGTLPSGAKLEYKLTTLDNDTTIASGLLEAVNATDSRIGGMVTIPSEAVELWWPIGMGNQSLYYLTITLVSSSSDDTPLASLTKRIGFRTIVLNSNPITSSQFSQGIAPGNNWHFEINGQEFYSKGSNFIPPDAFWTRVTPEKISSLFDTAIAGNQNMLRVWSSGAYSPDFMYELADEKGLLLWSEFEFGCALYPVDEGFLENVRQEAEYQVRRVNHHPSLTFWAGGNELENLELPSVNASSATPEEYERYVAEYEKLFLHTLLPVVFGNSRSISYQPSSTSNGWLSLNHSAPTEEIMVQRYNNLTEGSIYGERDFYNYNPAVLGNTTAYPIGRFTNEFGYHSMPSTQTWRTQIAERDLRFNSTTILKRNMHNPPGNLDTNNLTNSLAGQGQMTRAVEMWYPHINKTDPVKNFTAWCLATQIFQAEFYTSQIEFYRRGSGLPERQLGSLYWQLEDLWAAPTWSSVEHTGRWKVLHYAAKRAYEHVIIAPYFDISTGNLSVWVTSDLWSPATGTATFTWYDWEGKKLDIGVGGNHSSSSSSSTTTVDVSVGAINSTQVLQLFTSEVLHGMDLDNVLLHMKVSVESSLPNSNTTTTQTFTHENWFHARPLRTAKIVDPGLEVRYYDDDDDDDTENDGKGERKQKKKKKFVVQATRGTAAWVWLDYPAVAGGVVAFEDNGFWLGGGEMREVGFVVLGDDGTEGKWVEEVSVGSMWDFTQAE